MKYSIIAFTLILGLLSCNNIPEQKDSKSNSQSGIFKDVSPTEFSEGIKKEGIQLIDVRTSNEVNSGKIPGAINYDIYGADFKAQINALDKSKPVYVYCAVGGRSGKAMKMMKSMGFSEVYNLDGGMNAWKSKGLPVE